MRGLSNRSRINYRPRDTGANVACNYIILEHGDYGQGYEFVLFFGQTEKCGESLLYLPPTSVTTVLVV